jgi:Ca2+-binding RTX toxin-like protein
MITAGSGDILLGNEGDDAFYISSGGDNILTGGSGADKFWIATAIIF